MNKLLYFMKIRIGLQTRLSTRDAAEIMHEIKTLINTEYKDEPFEVVIKKLGTSKQVVSEYSSNSTLKNPLVTLVRVIIAFIMMVYTVAIGMNSLLMVDFLLPNIIFVLLGIVNFWLFIECDRTLDSSKQPLIGKLRIYFVFFSCFMSAFIISVIIMLRIHDNGSHDFSHIFSVLFRPYIIMLGLYLMAFVLLIISVFFIYFKRGINHIDTVMIGFGFYASVMGNIALVREIPSDILISTGLLLSVYIPLMVSIGVLKLSKKFLFKERIV